MNKFKKLFDLEKEYLKKYEIIADAVLKLDDEFTQLSDEQLVAKTDEFINRLNDGQTVEDIQVEAFATVREAANRVLKMKPFKVQIIGACALTEGNIAEMKTGEGKTLMATLPVYLLALKKQGVHVVTVNDYLASRDSEQMGQIYNFLGLTVGLNYRELSPTEKREAYACDITYTTNSELGFDYLRDNMVMKREERTQRGLFNVIVDEVDSILIDEARTPLIISGQEKTAHNMYSQVDVLVKNLREERDFTISLKDKTTHLTENGIDLIERGFGIKNLFDVEHSQLTHAVNQSLKANFNMHKDFDYAVLDGKIVIIDQFTGRTMEGRAYSDGLHQAIEAKESLVTQKETKTMATVTYQNFFRLYDVIAGMTGTAKTEEEEFQETYSMDVVSIPTNVDIKRIDLEDTVFATKRAKNEFMMRVIKERHEAGQPILIGTVAIESSEEISQMLAKAGIRHQVLNAKHHESEAEIIARAGEKGIVTVATNMAGRGTDIKLSDEVKNLEPFMSSITNKEEDARGLMIIGTERHESRRIDNQLRGRAGRQGDCGLSAFFVSFEDDLLRRYGGEKATKVLSVVAQDEAISHKFLTKRVETAQKEVESINYEVRKNLLKYDDVLREQREIMYYQRDYIIDSKDLIADSRVIIDRYINSFVKYHIELEDIEGLKQEFNRNISNKSLDYDGNDYYANAIKIAFAEFDSKIEEHGEEVLSGFCKTVLIKVLDEAWIDHIDAMHDLRESIGLRGYGQIDPLQEYQKEGRAMFEDMIDYVEKEIVKILLRGRIQTAAEREAMIRKLQEQHKKTVGQKTETVVVEQKDKVGRNEQCPCGSGKKYKNCHGA